MDGVSVKLIFVTVYSNVANNLMEDNVCLSQNLLDGGAMNNLIGGLAGGGHRAAANVQPNVAEGPVVAAEEEAEAGDLENDAMMDGANNGNNAAQGRNTTL